ncbi:hypothetical protein C0993_007205 [Termitomyces sp. T159_Od127]|nr:hypothetical protein C0993_007205 [Termitomyces sp. T159_Od127]
MSQDQSKSRGREAYVSFHCRLTGVCKANSETRQQSSGRGGAGNIRQASVSRDARPVDGPDDFSVSRGREPVPAHPKVGSVLARNLYTGRGGAGNIRSPSRDPNAPTVVEPQAAVLEERELIRAHNAATAEGPFSSGRGGAGNIVHSPPRPQPHGPALVHSTGRGGAGNILPGTAGDAYIGELKDIVERKAHGHDGELHSTGRGGLANITAAADPPVEHPVHAHARGEYTSSGRGGAGNIAKDGF